MGISPTVSANENFPISSPGPQKSLFLLDKWGSNQRLTSHLKGFDYLPVGLPAKVLLAVSEPAA